MRRGSTCALPGSRIASPRAAAAAPAGAAPADGWAVGWAAPRSDRATLDGVEHLLVEGGAATAAAFLAADLVDRLLLYRAPILIGGGKPALGDIGLDRPGRRARPLAAAPTAACLAATGSKSTSAPRRLMFTGIVTDIGTDRAPSSSAATCACASPPATTSPTIDLGASIACSGVCLTVVDKGDRAGSRSTSRPKRVARTAPGMWTEGRRLNLERALKLGDELGGHIVTGHVDGVGAVAAVARRGRFARGSTIVAGPRARAAIIAPKGSITVDGVSLTVNEVERRSRRRATSALNIIPHTAAVTTLGDARSRAGRSISRSTCSPAISQRMEALSCQNRS